MFWIIALSLTASLVIYQWLTMNPIKKMIFKFALGACYNYCWKLLTCTKDPEDNAIRVGNYLRVNVEYNRNSGHAYVPYSESLIPNSISNRLMIVSHGIENEISQLPGIPFMITANGLGVDEIVKTDELGDTTSYTGNDPVVI